MTYRVCGLDPAPFKSLFGLSDEELRETVEHDYLDRYFPHRDEPQCKVLAEGSVTYLYAPEQMRPILRLWPHAKFIVSREETLDIRITPGRAETLIGGLLSLSTNRR